jgi:hypothetical protein|tara:strand:- start:128 stop:307 length:180 start_codon:yes stop_codon:yes gene_type:complete
MSAENFVDELQNKNNLGAEDAFKSAMTDRVAQKLEMKRREVAGTFVKNHIPEVEEDETV